MFLIVTPLYNYCVYITANIFNGGILMRHMLVLVLLLPVTVFAQGNSEMPPNMPPSMPMDREKMQRMQEIQKNMQNMDMGKMQEAMACMKTIDRSALKGLDEEGKKIEAELKGLCRSGNRDEAQDKGMEYAKEMMSKPELQKMRECGKLAAGMLPKMGFEDLMEEGKDRHVCDDF